jgi:hypothetical protein
MASEATDWTSILDSLPDVGDRVDIWVPGTGRYANVYRYGSHPDDGFYSETHATGIALTAVSHWRHRPAPPDGFHYLD